MQIEGRVGVQALQDGSQQPPRLGKQGEVVTDELHGRYYEAVYRQGVWLASTAVAGVAPGTVLSTTPPFTLYNPTGNTKNFSINKIFMGYVSGTLGAGTLLVASGAQAAAPTGGTVITPKNALIGNGAAPTGLVYTGSTLTAAPTIVRPSFPIGAFLASTATLNPLQLDEVSGDIVLTPGNVLCLQAIAAAGTSPLVLLSMSWEEIPV